ncbi:uncharacterized protein LOC122798815 [Protopterus annectens]|uniref:uncharacterized protein LOC122798815 n=1 Tax=Protopterus annectens TaxID=7888 RepID=UPI001CFB52D2|nr:uncharacterized protein LOC122798815 [Protopterus annectens]
MSNVETLRSRIRSYNLRRRSSDLNLGFTAAKISIRLFGIIGHGKSSLINFHCVLNGTEYKNIADERNPELPDGAGTTILSRYPLDDTCLEILDMSGYNAFKYSEQIEIRNPLEGKRRVNSDVSFQGDFIASFEWAVSSVNPWSWSQWWSVWHVNESTRDDTIIVPVLVIRADWDLNSKELSDLHWFCTTVAYRYAGVKPLVVQTFGQKKPEREGTHVFPDLPYTKRFLLNNYHEESSTRNPNTDQNILEILNACIDCAEEVLNKCRGLAHKPATFQ